MLHWVRFLLTSTCVNRRTHMDQTRDDQPVAAAEKETLSAEDANRQAAAERAYRYAGGDWSEDRRKRPGTRANRREGHAEG